LNFTKNNGPGSLQLYSQARTILFNSFDDDVIALSKNWYSNNYGMNHGDQFPMTTKSKKYIWGIETPTAIIQGVDEAVDTVKNNFEANDFTNIDHVKSSLIVAWRHLASHLRYGLMQEDILLFKGLKKMNTQFKFFDCIEKPLLELPEEIVSPAVLRELFAKSDEAIG
jgi:hypothetical protein